MCSLEQPSIERSCLPIRKGQTNCPRTEKKLLDTIHPTDTTHSIGKRLGLLRKQTQTNLASVALACNPSYSEAETWRLAMQSLPEQIVLKTLSSSTKQGWWSGSRCRP
jgi:hypothetical protein